MLFTEYLWVSAENLIHFLEGRTVVSTQGQHAFCIAVIKEQNGVESLSVQSRYLVRASVTAFQVMQC